LKGLPLDIVDSNGNYQSKYATHAPPRRAITTQISINAVMELLPPLFYHDFILGSNVTSVQIMR